MAVQANVLNGMDLVTLRILLAAKDERNLARVAERENIALSAVSRRIAEFEHRYGFAIFHRHDRGVSMTPDGADILSRLTVVMGDMEKIASDLIDRRNGAAGIVRVQAHMSAVVAGLPEKISSFMALHPNIEVILDEYTSSEIIRDVQSGLCDLGLVSGTMDVTGLESIDMSSDELVAIVPTESALAQHDRLMFQDLLDQPFICMQQDSALLALYRQQADVHDRKLHERVHATSFESVRLCVRAGLGVSILPRAAVSSDPQDMGYHIRSLGDNWAKRSLRLCFRSKGLMSAAARAVVTHLTGQIIQRH